MIYFQFIGTGKETFAKISSLFIFFSSEYLKYDKIINREYVFQGFSLATENLPSENQCKHYVEKAINQLKDEKQEIAHPSEYDSLEVNNNPISIENSETLENPELSQEVLEIPKDQEGSVENQKESLEDIGTNNTPDESEEALPQDDKDPQVTFA